MKRRFSILILLLVLGSYIGINFAQDSSCVGPYRQRIYRLTITKPFVIGYWELAFGFGNKHWDYKEKEQKLKRWVCDKDNFGLKDGQKITQTCYWEVETYVHQSGCAYWYDKGYEVENVIDLTPWSLKVKN